MAKIKQKAVICDIDGVLLDTAHIFDRIEKAGLQGNDKWDFSTGMQTITMSKLIPVSLKCWKFSRFVDSELYS